MKFPDRVILWEYVVKHIKRNMAITICMGNQEFQNNEENVVFTKIKGPFSMNVKFKRWFCQCEQ